MTGCSFKIAVIVLAAGRSLRMGDSNKLLMKVAGREMVARTVEQARSVSRKPVVVVTGHEAQKVREVVGDKDVVFVHNEQFEHGLSTSLKAGITALEGDVDGALVMLGDMPLVSIRVLEKLLGVFQSQSSICQPVVGKRRGNPVIWGREYFAEICGVEGDKGGRGLLEKYHQKITLVEVKSDSIFVDFDRPEDFQKRGR
jgi:molybdenum cofactor cytidylyltransferase